MDGRYRAEWPLIALAAVSMVAFWAVYVVFVHTYHGQRVDDEALAGRAIASSGTDAAAHLLNTISVGSIVLAIALLVAQAWVRGRPDLSLVAAAVIVASVLSAELCKHVILTRPTLAAGPIPVPSYPSGHTAVAFSVGVAATLCVPARMRRRTALIAVAYGSAIGVATLAAGWHRPSDVAGGLLLVISFAAVIAAIARIDERGVEAVGAARRDAGRYLIGGLVVLLIGWMVAIAIVLASQSGALDWTLGSAAFFGACAAILALASVLMAALLWSLPSPRADTATTEAEYGNSTNVPGRGRS
jgi:membrane-associated phospholipid phosphatase